MGMVQPSLHYNKALVHTQPSIVLLPGIHHLVLQCISFRFRFTDLYNFCQYNVLFAL